MAETLRNEQLAWRARTVQAAAGTTRGELAMQTGNGGLAWMCFRRVLRVYPTTTRAAIGLARLHERDGRHDEARQVLVDALEATEHLTEARGRLVGAAVSLHIDLPVPEDVAGPGATSASTVPPADMADWSGRPLPLRPRRPDPDPSPSSSEIESMRPAPYSPTRPRSSSDGATRKYRLGAMYE